MSIYVLNSKKNGKQYGIRFRVTENGELVHKNLSPFKTQAEAKRAQFEYVQKNEIENTMQKVSAIEPTKVIFNDIITLYKRYAIDNLAPSSLYDYYRVIDTIIAPAFGDKPILDVNKRLITEFQDNIPKEYSYKYKMKIRTVLSAIMTFAVNRDYIENNPVGKVEKIRNNQAKKTMLYWTKDEFDKFITAVDNPTYKALFTFLYLSGCRKGEAFGLLKTKINYKNKTILIDCGITKKGTIMSEKLGKCNRASKTKNSKTGNIYMPEFSLALIKEQYTDDGIYAFGGEKPLAETTVSRVFNRYIEKAEVKKIRLHDLRHSCAALFISLSNAELTVLYALAERLRDSVEQVLKTYGHLFPSKQAEIIKTLDKLYN